jgi:hypothetical protein
LLESVSIMPLNLPKSVHSVHESKHFPHKWPRNTRNAQGKTRMTNKSLLGIYKHSAHFIGTSSRPVVPSKLTKILSQVMTMRMKTLTGLRKRNN